MFLTAESKAAYLRVKDVTTMISFHAQSSGLSFELAQLGKQETELQR